KLYNPNRVKGPMKRTNPRKGKDEDPGWVPISWDAALDLLAEKLRAIRETSFVDENGYPKLAVTFGAGGTAPAYLGGFPAFMSAWDGPLDQGIGSGQGMKCVHSEHLYGEYWHRAFTVAPDMPNNTYVLSFGNNGDVSGGVIGIWRHAEARGRGATWIQFEPHLSVTAATAAEWVPIKPKTDAAVLYAIIHTTLHVEGVTQPLRPVAILLGKSINNGWGGYECCWARTVMAALVGGLEVPGGILGTTIRLNRPSSNRMESVRPGPDGFMAQPLNA